MTNSLEDEVRRVVASMDERHNGQEQEPPGITEQETKPEETIHIHYFPDAIVILKEDDEAQIVDSAPVLPRKISKIPAYAICGFYLLCILSCIAFQVYCIFNPPIATVTIIPKSQHVTLSGTLQLGRILSPFTLSQSQTVPTTGKGHQSAKAATGYITFYNGQFQRVFIAAGTILTGASGVQIVTDQDASIPAGNPPSFGQVTVSAHALVSSTRGNIPAYDINQACCAVSVLAKNTQPWTGGQDERDFHTVAKSDIGVAALQLETTLAQSVAGVFQGQLKPNEHLQLLPCAPTVTTDYQPGEEATQVHITVSETCSAVAYDKGALQAQATALLSTQAATKLGTGYSLVGDVQVTVKQVRVTQQNKPVVLSFHALGTWVYAVNNAEQQRIKSLLAGKTKQEALQMLFSLPGIEHVSIAWADDTKLPKNSKDIHIVLFVM